MVRLSAELTAPLPSFSIVLETENLANANLKGLVKSIKALANQDPPPTCANEVLLIDSGDTPTGLLEQLCQQYPWIQVHYAPVGTSYYKAKMLGAGLATGEIIVYYDSDCLYEPNWLRTILSSFGQGPNHPAAAQTSSLEAKPRTQSVEVHIVAGETTTRGVGPYSTAMALTYIFPQYSKQKQLTPSHQYFLNNVAFRRQFLLQHPIPTELPLYRGHCVIHAHDLRAKGFTIWRQPRARANHAPPNGLWHFFWRFLLIGHDYYWQNRLLKGSGKLASQPTPTSLSDPTLSGMNGKLQIFYDRIHKMLVNEPLHAIFLPLAIPTMIASVLLIYVGYLITVQKPHYLLDTYHKISGEY